MQGREVIFEYKGANWEADAQHFNSAVQEIETRYLPYFINRSCISKEDEYERLRDNFFFVHTNSQVILILAYSSVLPSEIINELLAAFQNIFENTAQ
jgi:hypothetical protein